MDSRSPIRVIAINQFEKKFSDLLSIRAQISLYERSLIEGTYELMWFEHYERDDYKNWEQTARAAYNYIDKGTNINLRAIAEKFYKVLNQIPDSLNTCHQERQKAKTAVSKDWDTKIKLYLAYYKALHERLLTVIMSPILYSFALVNNINDQRFKPRDDGKISLNAIKEMEKWNASPENRLAIGLNSHIRNAYSHENYKILDDGKVELWDVHPTNPAKNWGPEIWHFDNIKDICNMLWLNSLAVVIGLVIFSVNNRKVVLDRGWFNPPPMPPLRRDELKHTVAVQADGRGFDLKDLKISNKIVYIKLSTRPKGIDQNEEIIMGGDSWSKKYIKPTVYLESQIAEQVIGLLQIISSFLKAQATIKEVTIEVKDYEDNLVGHLTIDIDKIDKIPSSNEAPISEAKKLLKKDTLYDNKMWVKISSKPIQMKTPLKRVVSLT